MQTVSSIIRPTSTAYTVQEDVSICSAVACMSRLGVNFLLVVDGEADIVGVLTERDVLLGVVAADIDPNSVVAADLMSRDLPMVHRSTPLEEAMELMARCSHQHLLVADCSTIVGIVSFAEVSRSLVQDRDALIGDLTYYITH